MSAEKPDVWMPLYIGAYLRKTARLTTEQHGAYLLLIMDYWVAGPPPDDDEQLASVARLPLAGWKKMRSKLIGFFAIVDGAWRHERIDREIAEAAENVIKKRAAGLASAKHRANRKPTPVGIVLPKNGQKSPTDGQQNGNPLPSPSPSEGPTREGLDLSKEGSTPPDPVDGDGCPFDEEAA